MKNQAYATINVKNLKENISNIKKEYPFSYTIFNVSNHAFFHGMYLINYVLSDINYFYTVHFSDVVAIRKYQKDVKIIYDGPINEDNVYDLILNNVVLLISNFSTMEFLLHLNIKDQYEIMFQIDKKGYHGIDSKQTINSILDQLKNHIHIHILGVLSWVNEKEYLDFNYIISPLKSLELIVLNSEKDKKKIKRSNAILLDTSIYGLHYPKKRMIKKEFFPIKPILEVHVAITNIIVQRKKRKESYLGVINFGYYQGMIDSIHHVFIHNKKYPIKEIQDTYSLIQIDEDVSKDDFVLLDIQHLTPTDITILMSSIPTTYDECEIEKSLI